MPSKRSEKDPRSILYLKDDKDVNTIHETLSKLREKGATLQEICLTGPISADSTETIASTLVNSAMVYSDVTKLSMARCKLTDGHIMRDQLSDLFMATRDSALRVLDLSRNSITSIGATELFNGLYGAWQGQDRTSSLRVILLSRNRLGDTDDNAPIVTTTTPMRTRPGMPPHMQPPMPPQPPSALAQLAEAARKMLSHECCGLIALDLSRNHFNAEFLSTFAPAAARARTLKVLSLQACHLGPDSAGVLAEMLRGTRSLEYLDISGNRIGDVGMQTIMQGFQRNNKLDTLLARYTGLGDKACTELAATLRVNTRLRAIDISDNPISRTAITRVLDSLHDNGVVETFVCKGLKNDPMSAALKEARWTQKGHSPNKKRSIDLFIYDQLGWLSRIKYWSKFGVCWPGFLSLVVTMGLYIFDVITDILVLETYYRDRDTIWFVFSAFFILLNQVVIGLLFSLVLYRKTRVSIIRRWTSFYVFGYLIETLLIMKRHKGNWESMQRSQTGTEKNLSNVVAMRTVAACEALLESLPQTFLQAYVLFQKLANQEDVGTILYLSALLSVCTLSLSFARYMSDVVVESQNAYHSGRISSMFTLVRFFFYFLFAMASCLCRVALPAMQFQAIVFLIVAAELIWWFLLYIIAVKPEQGRGFMVLGRALVLSVLSFGSYSDLLMTTPRGRYKFREWMRNIPRFVFAFWDLVVVAERIFVSMFVLWKVITQENEEKTTIFHFGLKLFIILAVAFDFILVFVRFCFQTTRPRNLDLTTAVDLSLPTAIDERLAEQLKAEQENAVMPVEGQDAKQVVDKKDPASTPPHPAGPPMATPPRPVSTSYPPAHPDIAQKEFFAQQQPPQQRYYAATQPPPRTQPSRGVQGSPIMPPRTAPPPPMGPHPFAPRPMTQSLPPAINPMTVPAGRARTTSMPPPFPGRPMMPMHPAAPGQHHTVTIMPPGPPLPAPHAHSQGNMQITIPATPPHSRERPT
eukprot:gnl/Trimastix_PCT/1551.p1 GENE.gnl/Trimastix_PCT/1551~~gnl/Trimastix_PCT/1551.p1  ORF type:complete len:977 (+),score=317.75 gnl/Trimastix_PCT/1551:86-3016(+)